MKITKLQLKQLIKEELSNILEISENENTRFVVRAFSNIPRKRGEALLFQVIANSAEEAIEIAKASSQIDNSQPIEIAHEYMINEADGHQMAVEKLKQIIKEEMSSVLEEETDGTREASPTRKASPEEVETLIKNSESGDSLNYERGRDVQTSFIEDALNITIIARTASKIYVRPGRNRGYHSGKRKPIYILGKLL